MCCCCRVETSSGVLLNFWKPANNVLPRQPCFPLLFGQHHWVQCASLAVLGPWMNSMSVVLGLSPDVAGWLAGRLSSRTSVAGENWGWLIWWLAPWLAGWIFRWLDHWWCLTKIKSFLDLQPCVFLTSLTKSGEGKLVLRQIMTASLVVCLSQSRFVTLVLTGTTSWRVMTKSVVTTAAGSSCSEDLDHIFWGGNS